MRSVQDRACRDSFSEDQKDLNEPLLESEDMCSNPFLGGEAETESLPLRDAHSADPGVSKENLWRASVFLQDALCCHSPHDYQHTYSALRLHSFRFSWQWRVLFGLTATLTMMMSTLDHHREYVEKDDTPNGALSFSKGVLLSLKGGQIAVFTLDLILLVSTSSGCSPGLKSNDQQRCSAGSLLRGWCGRPWVLLFGLYILLSVLDVATGDFSGGFPWSAPLKPVVLFYFSDRARVAMHTTLRLLPSSCLVIAVELYVLCLYTCLCVALYGDSPQDLPGSFPDLGTAFVTLFALSTTVNNPDSWLSLYAENRWNGIVFVSFLVIFLCFVHNLVLASIFKDFTSQLGPPMQERRAWRRDAIRFAFDALEPEPGGLLPETKVIAVLHFMRPHYGPWKLKVLYRHIDTNLEGQVDFDTFMRVTTALNMCVRNVYTRQGKKPMPQEGGAWAGGGWVSTSWVFTSSASANNTSAESAGAPPSSASVASLPSDLMRSDEIPSRSDVIPARSEGRQAVAGKWKWNIFWNSRTAVIFGDIVSAVNFAFVLLMCGKEEGGRTLFRRSFWIGAAALTLASCVDLASLWQRCGGRLSLMLRDGFSLAAITAAGCSMAALVWALIVNLNTKSNFFEIYRFSGPVVLMVLGRILDMLRPLARVPYFRNILYSAFSVMPTILGQAAVILTIFHVGAYLGMAMWGNSDIPDDMFAGGPTNYHHLRFGTYIDSLVTLFELLVVNNWQIIASGYVNVWGRSAYIFFIGWNLIVNTIALNVFTAFFINAFLVKFEEQAPTADSNTVSPSFRVSTKRLDLEDLAGVQVDTPVTSPGDRTDRGVGSGGVGAVDDSSGVRTGEDEVSLPPSFGTTSQESMETNAPEFNILHRRLDQASLMERMLGGGGGGGGGAEMIQQTDLQGVLFASLELAGVEMLVMRNGEQVMSTTGLQNLVRFYGGIQRITLEPFKSEAVTPSRSGVVRKCILRPSPEFQDGPSHADLEVKACVTSNEPSIVVVYILRRLAQETSSIFDNSFR